MPGDSVTFITVYIVYYVFKMIIVTLSHPNCYASANSFNILRNKNMIVVLN